MKVCKKCLLPETYETIEFAEDYSSCNICNLSDEKAQIQIGQKRKKCLMK